MDCYCLTKAIMRTNVLISNLLRRVIPEGDSNSSEDKDVKDKQSKVISYCKPLFDIDEAAELLNVSTFMVRGMVKARKITFVKLGARVLFRPQDLIDFIDSHLIQPQAGPGGTVS